MNNWQIFLFDFDGTLVDSEPLHHLAYKKTCEEFGFPLDKDLSSYCLLAHQSSDSLRRYLENQCFAHKKIQLNWEVFYQRKKKRVLETIASGPVFLALGAESFLQYLLEWDITLGVVTQSSLELVQMFQDRIPILKKIRCWVTREDYKHAKPSADGYHVALQKLGNGKAIGFEDSIKGMQALLNAKLDAIMVNAHVTKEKAEEALGKNTFFYFPSFVETFSFLQKNKLECMIQKNKMF